MKNANAGGSTTILLLTVVMRRYYSLMTFITVQLPHRS